MAVIDQVASQGTSSVLRWCSNERAIEADDMAKKTSRSEDCLAMWSLADAVAQGACAAVIATTMTRSRSRARGAWRLRVRRHRAGASGRADHHWSWPGRKRSAPESGRRDRRLTEPCRRGKVSMETWSAPSRHRWSRSCRHLDQGLPQRRRSDAGRGDGGAARSVTGDRRHGDGWPRRARPACGPGALPVRRCGWS